MRCHTCDTETDPRTRECPRCRTPIGAPALHPGARLHPVEGVGRAAAVAVGAVVLASLGVPTVQLVNVLLARQAAGAADGDELLLVAGLLELGVGLALTVALLVAAVLVIIWSWRARSNLDAFPGAGPTLASGWAIAGWLVPFVNLVVPYRVVANIARESLWRLSTPWLVKLWWGAWLGYLLTDRISSRSTIEEFDALPYPQTSADFEAYVDYYATTSGTYLLPTLACVLAGVPLIVLIRQISAAQTARIARGMPTGPIMPGMTLGGTTPAPATPALAGSASAGSASAGSASAGSASAGSASAGSASAGSASAASVSPETPPPTAAAGPGGTIGA
ncbi:DUF4328 domain-containing protein [Micromonospora radicis]|uniref:DUF4328 domain-containing protein n=1 Tax=Micromonospora radicis TaxID=1894971 RepID=A0A418MPS1_9ACTN|nr:DUF4328 domain-containing protein [Micromonospora radicis]RIV34454.1 DUF4328 domain-containing protein [Micromonospora radicis]